MCLSYVVSIWLNPTARTGVSFLLLLTYSLNVHSQELQSSEHDRNLKGLSDVEKVEYLLDNSYSLYSINYDHALKLMREGYAIAKKHQWKDKEASFAMYQGVILYLKGDFSKALASYLTAYSLFDSLKHYDGLSHLCNELGVFYRKNGDAEKALAYLGEAERFAKLTNNRTELATSYSHKAVMLDQQGHWDEAEDLYREVYRIRLDDKDSVGLGYALLDLATIELRNENPGKALEYIQESTAIRKKTGDLQGVAVNLVDTGETYYSVKNYRKAIQYFEECLALAIEIGYTDLVRYTYEQLATTNVRLGDYRSAYAYQQQGRVFGDSLFNIEKARAIAELQTKYETEKKEQQIALQQAQLAERGAEIRQTYLLVGALVITVALVIIIFVLSRARYKKQQQLLIRDKEISVKEAYMLASIQSQENERKRFAQDLHDGLGQLISALRLSLLSVNQNSSLEERVAVVNKAESLLNDMHREIRAIAFNLMPQTLVQHGLDSALREMSDRINQSGHVLVRISSFDLPGRLPEVQEISLYRVIQEWVNNIIKHSNARLIEVQLVRQESDINVIVEDNGDGFDGVKLERSPGNGWKNIRSRINLLKGTVAIDSSPERKGTTLIIQVPMYIHSQRNSPEIARLQ